MTPSPQSVLTGALLTGNLEHLKAALAAGADPNCVNREGHTPLMQAIMRRQLEAVECLVGAGAALNPANPAHNPLDFARALKNRKIVALLEARGAPTATAEPTAADKDLYLAARTGKTALLQRALPAGAELNRDFGNGTALCHAIYRGHEEMVRALLDAGASAAVTDSEGNNRAVRALEDAQTLPHHASMRALLAQRLPQLFAAQDTTTPHYPAYDIDVLLDPAMTAKPLLQLHSLLMAHQGNLREHELLFLATQEAKIQIPWNGLHGWFFNLANGVPIQWAARGLAAIGALQAGRIVQESLAVFPPSLNLKDDAAFQDALHSLSPAEEALLNDLDSRFYETDDDVDRLSLAWLQANRELFRQARPI